ncbi:MAG: hypothetical protein HYZ73_00980 [Elusimicrobia bacterium]|nr:hypothetical protein [Elusimicrobiota bacterium]
MLWSEALLARSFVGVIQRLPWRIACRVGSAVGRLVPFVMRGRQQLATENFRQAFPDMESKQRARCLRAMWSHLGRVAAEFTKIPQLCPENVERYTTLVDFYHVDRALALGRGVIFLTAHCGNWELMAPAIVMKGYRTAVVVRPLHHPVVDRIVNQIRASHGIVVIPHRQAVREGIRRLRQNWTLGILMEGCHYPGAQLSGGGSDSGRRTTAAGVGHLVARGASGSTGCGTLQPTH